MWLWISNKETKGNLNLCYYRHLNISIGKISASVEISVSAGKKLYQPSSSSFYHGVQIISICFPVFISKTSNKIFSSYGLIPKENLHTFISATSRSTSVSKPTTRLLSPQSSTPFISFFMTFSYTSHLKLSFTRSNLLPLRPFQTDFVLSKYSLPFKMVDGGKKNWGATDLKYPLQYLTNAINKQRGKQCIVRICKQKS